MPSIFQNLASVNDHPGRLLLTLTIILLAGASGISIVLRIVRLNRPGLPTLVAVGAAFGLSPLSTRGLLVAAIPLVIGIAVGRSTRVAPDTFLSARSIKLSPVDYRRRMQEIREMAGSRQFNRFLLSPNVGVVAKLNLYFQLLSAHLYRATPALVLLVSPVYIWYWSFLNAENSGFGDLRPLLFVLSLPYGTALGMLVRYILGSREELEIHGDVFSPTARSFLKSLLWSLSPAGSVGTMLLILGPGRARSLLILVPSVLMLTLSVALVAQDIMVHRQRLVLHPEGLAIWSSGAPYGVVWSEVQVVKIRERHNRYSGVDRLLQIQCADGRPFAYPISILSAQDQSKILIAIRSKAPTKTVFDRGVL